MAFWGPLASSLIFWSQYFSDTNTKDHIHEKEKNIIDQYTINIDEKIIYKILASKFEQEIKTVMHSNK